MPAHSAGLMLIFGLPHHHNTTSNLKVESINSIVAYVLCSVANKCGNYWPEFIQLVEIAINNLELPLGSGYTE
jgi:hypothetical protein